MMTNSESQIVKVLHSYVLIDMDPNFIQVKMNLVSVPFEFSSYEV